MTEVHQRPLNVEEQLFLESQLPTTKEKIGKFVFIYFMSSMLPLLALIVFLTGKHSLSTILVSFLIYLIITFTVTLIIYFNASIVTGLDNYISALKNGNVCVWIIRPISIYKRKSKDGVPIGYYIKIQIDNQNETLFLEGDYINQLEKNPNFPNTCFEIVRTSEGNIVLSTNIYGTKILPDKIINSPKHEEYFKGFTPSDNTFIDCDIFNIN